MNKQILRLAIPNIISNLSVPLLSSVDTALMGHLDEMYYLGALAVGGIIFNFLYWGFGFLRMGTTGLAAQAFGKEDRLEMALILARTLLLALAGGGALILLQKPIAALSFRLIEATPLVERYAREYFFIRIYAAPATLALYVFHGWFLGMQNARYPLLLTVVVNVANLGLNLFFVRHLHLNSAGVAYGTVIAQYLGLLLAGVLFLRRYRPYLLRFTRGDLLEARAVRRAFSVNGDIFLRTLGLIFTFSYFTAESAARGELVLAVNSILLQLINLLAYGVDGFAFAAESLVGRYLGARDARNLRRAVRYAFRWGMGLGAAFAVGFGLFREPILWIFTDKPAVVAEALVYMPWVIVAPLINSYCFIWDGIFIGATATAAMRNSMLFCTFLVFLPAYWLLQGTLGNHSLWLALTLFMIMRGVTLKRYSRRHVFGRVT